MKRRHRIVWGAGMALAMCLGLCGPGGERLPAQGGAAKADPEHAPALGKRGQEFIAAFNKGDAKVITEFWAPDAEYVDQSGRSFKGRPAIQKLYEKTFAENKGARLEIHIESVRSLTPDVGVQTGITEVHPANGGPPTVAQYTAVLVKKEGVWYLEQLHEHIARPPSHFVHLEDLEFLVGEWKGEDEKGESATASYSWAENQNFLVSSFATTLNGIPVVGGTQWIGWDAVDKQVRSWSFYSGGGVGEATWTKEGAKWAIKTSARTAQGKKISLTNILTKIDEDHISWQPTQVTVDGKAVPDGAVIKLKRVKGEIQP
jgi:uncharacterized protein (TIGR02246 family)